MEKKTSVFDLNEKMAALVAYSFFFITGIMVIIMERENKFVRFAALQSIVFFILMALVGTTIGVLSIIPILGWIFRVVGSFIAIVTVVTWLFLMLTAAAGKAIKIPIIGQICWNHVHKEK